MTREDVDDESAKDEVRHATDGGDEHKEEAVKAVNASAWSTKLEGRVLV